MADGRVELEVTADTGDAEKKVNEVGDAAKKAGDEADKAGSSAFRKVEKGASSAEGDADALGDAAKAAGDQAESAGAGAFGEVVQGAKDATGEIGSMSGALGALGGGLSLAGLAGLADQASELNSYMSRLEASADANNVSAQAMSDTYSGLVGVLGETDRSVETAGNMFALCGDDQARLQELTTALTGAYSQFGDGLPIEGLAEAANETAKVGTVTGSFADALNWVSASQEQWNAALEGHPAAMRAFNDALDAGMSKEDAFNTALAECTTEQERAQLVTQALSSLYGEQGSAYEEANADAIAYRQAQDELSGAMAELGEDAMPLVTEAMGAASDALGWLGDNMGTVAPMVAGLAGGFVALRAAMAIEGIVDGLVRSWQLYKASTEGATIAQWLLNAAMNANPFVLIVTVIVALVAAIAALWATNEDFRAFIEEAWGAIKAKAEEVWGAVVNFFTVTVPQAIQSMITGFQELPGKIGEFLGGVLSSVGAWVGQMASQAAQAGSRFLSSIGGFFTQLPGRVGSFLSSVISSVGSFAGQMASGALKAGGQFLSNIVNTLSSIPGKVVEIGSNIVQGIINGITGAAGKITSTLIQMADDALGGVLSFLGIASPSKVFRDRVGRWIPLGAAEGVEEEAGAFRRAVDDAFAYAPDVSTAYSWVPKIGSPQVPEIAQTVNFYQPVETPDRVARAMRRYATYGLAGARG